MILQICLMFSVIANLQNIFETILEKSVLKAIKKLEEDKK